MCTSGRRAAVHVGVSVCGGGAKGRRQHLMSVCAGGGGFGQQALVIGRYLVLLHALRVRGGAFGRGSDLEQVMVVLRGRGLWRGGV